MAHVADHLSVLALEQQYRSCTDVTAARHFQTIWLLAKGHEMAEVAATVSFARRWVERFSSGAAVPVLHGRDRGTALSDDLASGQGARDCRGRGHGLVCAALGGDPMGAIGSPRLSGRVRALNHPRGSDHASPLPSTTRTPC